MNAIHSLRENIHASHEAISLLATYYLAVFLLFPALAVASAGNEQPKKNMSIRVHFNVNWKIRSGEMVNRGKYDLHCNGIADLNKTWSMMDQAAPPGSFITYSVGGVSCQDTYEEKVFQDDPPEGCGPLLAEYHGAGSFNLQQLNTGMTSDLNIRKLGSLIPKSYQLCSDSRYPSSMATNSILSCIFGTNDHQDTLLGLI